MNRISSPRELLLQLYSLERWGANAPEHGGETSSGLAAGQEELTELFFALSANGNGSPDGGGDPSGPLL